MKRIARLFYMIVLIFAVTLSASGVVHASVMHAGHGVAMSTASMDNHDHAHRDSHASIEDHVESEDPDPVYCCIAMAGACSGVMVFLPTVSLSEPSICMSDPYTYSDARLSGIDPDRALRPPRA